MIWIFFIGSRIRCWMGEDARGGRGRRSGDGLWVGGATAAAKATAIAEAGLSAADDGSAVMLWSS